MWLCCVYKEFIVAEEEKRKNIVVDGCGGGGGVDQVSESGKMNKWLLWLWLVLLE